MFYLTGDTHGDFRRIAAFCDIQGTSKEDILIILGDAGINYYEPSISNRMKQKITALPITFLCIHGNHEARPQTIPAYHEIEWHSGKVMVEDAYPDILFAIDGQVYDLDGRRALVIGGAYSVDKFYRIKNGLNWFPDEQPSDETKSIVESRIIQLRNRVDLVLSHTCPLRYQPVEMFLPNIDQNSVDYSTEKWLGSIEAQLSYSAWFCGHWHTNKDVHKIHFLFDRICALPAHL